MYKESKKSHYHDNNNDDDDDDDDDDWGSLIHLQNVNTLMLTCFSAPYHSDLQRKQRKLDYKHYKTVGGSPGLVVMEETRIQKVVGSNPSTVHRMDIFHIYLL